MHVLNFLIILIAISLKKKQNKKTLKNIVREKYFVMMTIYESKDRRIATPNKNKTTSTDVEPAT